MTSKPVDNIFDELYRKTLITARSSFCAARRLEPQYKLSQWTITLASVALTYIPLTQALGLSLELDVKTLNMLEVFFAILVLVFSLLIGSENYLLKADKMQRRGLELSSICYNLEPYRQEAGNNKLYKDFCNAYDQILSKFENHLPIDYNDYMLTKRDNFPSSLDYFKTLIKFNAERIASFAPYVLLLLPCLYLLIISLFPSFTLFSQ